MKIYIAHPSNFDFETELYAPFRNSELAKQHQFFFPHENGQSGDTKDSMNDFNLILAEVSLASTGEGIELGRAEALGVPILCVYKKGSSISGSLMHITTNFIEYEDANDMVLKVGDFLSK